MSTVTEMEGAIAKLPPGAQSEIALWLEERERLVAEELPEMLAAIDVGIPSLEQNGAHPISRTELGHSCSGLAWPVPLGIIARRSHFRHRKNQQTTACPLWHYFAKQTMREAIIAAL